MRARIGFAVVLMLLVSSLSAQSSRETTREKLRKTLEDAGKLSDVRATFRASAKEPFNFIATMDDGLANAEALEVVIRVTENDTINFRIYPHYKGGYINLDKVKDRDQLMRAMLLFSDHNFLFWGVDDEKDAFSGYTVTLESGFPAEAVETIVRSIRNTDRFVGRLRPFIDGSAGVEK